MKDKKQKIKKKKKGPVAKFFKILFLSLLCICVLGGFGLLGVGFAIINTAPELDLNQILSLNETSKIYDSNDKFMDNVITDEYRTSISLKDLPNRNLPNAFKSIEDERFDSHKGVDFKRVTGALLIDIKNKITKKSGLQGGSTITQQLIKNKVLGGEVSAKRKIQEMYLAIQLEKKLSKDQILEAYLNTILLGGKSYGVEAAANNYFGKTSKDLSLLECAFLAGMPQSPSRYYSYIQAMKASNNDPNLFAKKDTYVIDRTKAVLSKMYQKKCITKEQYDGALKDLSDKKLVFKGLANGSNRLTYEWFSLPVIEQVKKDLKEQYKLDDKQADLALMYNGLQIYTSMDKNLQDAAQKILDDNKNYGVKSEVDANGIIQPQASAVIMDYHNGEVKAIIGGRGTQPARSYNRAAYNGSKNFVKPTGSSIKPLTVYSAAIDTKAATAGTVIEDSPLPTEIGRLYPDGGKPYNPQNYDTEGFSGYVPIREAITRSINLVAIKLEHQIGLKTGAAYGEKYGLPLNSADKTSISALSLGEISGTNTLTMAAAYGTFGNNGLYTSPKLYRKVVDKTGKIILENKTTNKKILSPQSAYVMYDLLKGPVESGTATAAKFSDMPAAGKTGTSSKKKNFWFCGLTPYYSGAVWIGNDTPKTYEGGLGSNTSAAIWNKIMAEAHKDLTVKDVEAPSGLVRAAVCRVSGKLPTEACTRDPRGDMTSSELFIEGTVPTTFCDTHVEAKINKNNNKLATEFTPADLIISKVFIKRDYTPTAYLGDDPYVLPKEKDDTAPAASLPVVPTTPPPTPTGPTTPNPQPNPQPNKPKH